MEEPYTGSPDTRYPGAKRKWSKSRERPQERVKGVGAGFLPSPKKRSPVQDGKDARLSPDKGLFFHSRPAN